MKGKMKKIVTVFGLALLVTVPFTSYAKEGDYTIDDIGGVIQPPQYTDKNGDPIKNKIPSVDDWKKSVESQAVGGGQDFINK